MIKNIKPPINIAAAMGAPTCPMTSNISDNLIYPPKTTEHSEKYYNLQNACKSYLLHRMYLGYLLE